MFKGSGKATGECELRVSGYCAENRLQRGKGGSWDTLLVIIRLERMVALATMRAAKAMRNSQIMDLL